MGFSKKIYLTYESYWHDKKALKNVSYLARSQVVGLGEIFQITPYICYTSYLSLVQIKSTLFWLFLII